MQNKKTQGFLEVFIPKELTVPQSGDDHTFGKGTVQSIVPLAPMMERAGLRHTYDPGALKVTIRKFYRPGGASTQLVAANSIHSQPPADTFNPPTDKPSFANF